MQSNNIFGSINSPVIFLTCIFMQEIPVGKQSCRKQVNRGKLITSRLFWFARNSVARPAWLDPRSRRSRRDRDLRSVIMAVINHLVKLHRKLAWWENYSSVYKKIFSVENTYETVPLPSPARDCTQVPKRLPHQDYRLDTWVKMKKIGCISGNKRLLS